MVAVRESVANFEAAHGLLRRVGVYRCVVLLLSPHDRAAGSERVAMRASECSQEQLEFSQGSRAALDTSTLDFASTQAQNRVVLISRIRYNNGIPIYAI
ncbi:uncharacterized protein TRAVEDRAFT_54527 [Trametes versicolor FP-101664 SS1]|uniref:Uncharacterized protein n=1 Tax=Trametes versicolor (strain FP-101664) TaxID=717944 RepID=R7S944_TRAVS|nr:uncharacterized protein TRAVEDRAFT_54527 [Trametes versicolor FP-101664 SS1]EIW51489.1 hypothetical protein TRAVEDRAFT_54527 [Trametes versicolor FP-101664 SS1]